MNCLKVRLPANAKIKNAEKFKTLVGITPKQMIRGHFINDFNYRRF